MQGGQFNAHAFRIMARNWPAYFCAGLAALRCLWKCRVLKAAGGGVPNKLLQPPPDAYVSRAQGSGDGRDGIATCGHALRQLSLAQGMHCAIHFLPNGIWRGSV